MGNLAELNMDLIKRYKNGDNRVVEKLYLCNLNFIKNCAFVIARKFGCFYLFDELVSTGIITLLERLDNFDETKSAEFTTYLHPHLMGAMRREVEKNKNSISLSKREFEQICKTGLPFSVISFDDSKNRREYVADLEVSSAEIPLHRQVYIKICIELMREIFEHKLSFKEREILGGFFGVFNHEEQTLSKIGEQFDIKESSVLTARNNALKKLARICFEGEMGVWQDAYKTINKWI